MLLRTAAAFDRWVREPVDPRPLGWFRCWLGALTLVNILLLWPDMPMWLADDGVLPPELHQPPLPGPSLTVYALSGALSGAFSGAFSGAYSADTAAILLIRGLGVAGGLGMCLGVLPRCAAACVWLAITSYSWRNPLILHSGDALLRIATFFLIFAHTDAVLSLPRWLRRRRILAAGASEPLAPVPAWPQRILQLQLCILYLATGIWKSSGPAWQDGSAVGIVLQMGEFQRFPIPDILLTPVASRVLTWATLAFELGFPLLVWPRALRLPVLAVGLAFHAGLEWMLNVQLFQWTITAFYLLFLQPASGRPAVAPPEHQRPGDVGADRSVAAAGSAAAKPAPVRASSSTAA
jgi:hypothetical protein